MSRRLPGKKFKTEHFNIEGAIVSIEIRVTPEGEFFADVDGEQPKAKSLFELKTLIAPILIRTRKLEWDPYIQIDFEEGSSRFDNHRDTANRQEITLEFKAGWMTRTVVSGYLKEDRRRWVDAEVDEKTGEILEASYEEKRHSDAVHTFVNSQDKRIPFTVDRWRRLTAFAAAIADVRAKLHLILSDGTAARLDAVELTSNLLSAIPEAEPGRPRRRRG